MKVNKQLKSTPGKPSNVDNLSIAEKGAFKVNKLKCLLQINMQQRDAGAPEGSYYQNKPNGLGVKQNTQVEFGPV